MPVSSSTTISVTLRGASEAVLAVRGPVDVDSAGRVRDLLATVLAGGSVHVIVDLSAAGQVPAQLLDVLVKASWTLGEAGGWLLVEGAEPAEPDSDLLEAFRAYRDATVA